MGGGQDLLVRASVFSIHGIQVLGFNDLGQHVVANGDHGNHDEGKDHLHVEQWAHAKGTEQQQLQDLQACEVVDLPLGHPPDVVGGWV